MLSANNDKRIKLVDSVETYTYGINEEIIHRKKEIKCNNIMKKYEKWLTMATLQKTTTKNKKQNEKNIEKHI